MALPEIHVNFTRQDESGKVLLDQADLSFFGDDPVGHKAFFCDGTSGSVGIIETGPVAFLMCPPFVLEDTPELPPLVQQICHMTDQLFSLRKQNKERDSPEEDELLDAMDVVWYAMTSDEIQILEEIPILEERK